MKNELIQEAEKGYKSEFDEGRISAFEDMITFIDSLKEEPISNDLEEASVNYAATGLFLSNGKEMIDFQVEKAFKAGALWQKEQLMKDAVYGLVCGHNDNSPAWIDLNLLKKPDVKVGEEVKFIIIMEE